MIITLDDIGDVRKTYIGDLTVQDIQEIHYRQSGNIFVRYLYADMIQKWAQDMHNNVSNDFDNVIVIHGPEGSGKSNLAYQICRAYDENFDVSEQYVYNYEDFLTKISVARNHSVFWMDEASNMANNRDWNTESNKSIVNVLEMFRSRGWTLVMCIPHASRLDKYIRENRIRYIAKCEPMEFRNGGRRERGYYELKKKNPYGGMHLVGYGTYDPMPPDVKRVYEQIKLAAQDAKIQEMAARLNPSEGKTSYKKRYDEAVERRRRTLQGLVDRGMSDSEIMEIMGYDSYKTYHNDKSIIKKEGEINGN